VNVSLLRSTWATAAGFGDGFVASFYARLFLAHPELRDLFGVDMAGQRAKLADTLTLVVAGADNIEAVVPKLRRLGRMHRRFGVVANHYPAVGAALAATFEHYLGDDWTPEAHDTWRQAFELVAGVMMDAAGEADRAGGRARWDALVLDVTRTDGVLHLHLDPECGYPWPPAAHVDVRLADRAGTWRQLMATGSTVLAPVDARPDPVTLGLLLLQPGDHLWVTVDQEAPPR
jgi:hemoglobin-like flavoprotein